MFSSACIALSRRSDSWEGSEEKGARKMSTRGGLGVRIRNRGEREREIPVLPCPSSILLTFFNSPYFQPSQRLELVRACSAPDEVKTFITMDLTRAKSEALINNIYL